MAENSKIEWTHHTFNPWIGCTKVHTGCTHCYAEEMMDHRYGKAQWGPQGTRVRTSAANWRKPLAWDKAAAEAGERHRVFCASLADVFEDWSGPIMSSGKDPVILAKDGRASNGKNRATMDDVRSDLFELIDQTPNLDWLLLTKRPENVRRMWPVRNDDEVERRYADKIYPEYFREIAERVPGALYRKNVWLGASVSDKATSDSIVPAMADIRPLVPVMFLSAEPLVGDLGPDFVARTLCPQCDDGMVDITGDGGLDFFGPPCGHCGGSGRFIDWIIVGGESGAHRRPMQLDWARDIRDQCAMSGVAFFMKQIDKIQEIPADLMIREFPEPEAIGA